MRFFALPRPTHSFRTGARPCSVFNEAIRRRGLRENAGLAKGRQSGRGEREQLLTKQSAGITWSKRFAGPERGDTDEAILIRGGGRGNGMSTASRRARLHRFGKGPDLSRLYKHWKLKAKFAFRSLTAQRKIKARHRFSWLTQSGPQTTPPAGPPAFLNSGWMAAAPSSSNEIDPEKKTRARFVKDARRRNGAGFAVVFSRRRDVVRGKNRGSRKIRWPSSMPCGPSMKPGSCIRSTDQLRASPELKLGSASGTTSTDIAYVPS